MAILSLDQALGLSFAWLALCTLGYYGVPLINWGVRGVSGRWLRLVMVLIFAAALLVRLVPAFILPVGAQYDIESFQRVAGTFLKGQAVYSSPVVAGRHPYLPFQLYLIGGAGTLSEVTGMPFVLSVKLAPILADAALAVLIFQSTRQLGQSMSQALVRSLLYGLSPIAILVSAYHGQFDAETIFLLALSWYIWHFGDMSATRLFLSALLLGFAVLNKTWPLLFLPVVLLRLESLKQRTTYTLITLAVPVFFTMLYVAIFPQDLYPMLNRALTHAGVPGWWGGGAIINLFFHITGLGEGLLAGLVKYGRWLVFAGSGYVYWVTRRESGLGALATLLVVLNVLTSGFGLQWTLWVVPFALLADDLRGLNLYTLGALFYMLPSYYGYHFDPLLLRWLLPEQVNIILLVVAVPVWVLSIQWALRRLRVQSSLPHLGCG